MKINLIFLKIIGTISILFNSTPTFSSDTDQWYQKGLQHYIRSEFTEAFTIFEEQIPHDPRAKKLMAELLWHDGAIAQDIDKAIKLYTEIAPTDPYAANSLAVLFFIKKNDIAKAIKYFKIAEKGGVTLATTTLKEIEEDLTNAERRQYQHLLHPGNIQTSQPAEATTQEVTGF